MEDFQPSAGDPTALFSYVCRMVTETEDVKTIVPTVRSSLIGFPALLPENSKELIRICKACGAETVEWLAETDSKLASQQNLPIRSLQDFHNRELTKLTKPYCHQLINIWKDLLEMATELAKSVEEEA